MHGALVPKRAGRDSGSWRSEASLRHFPGAQEVVSSSSVDRFNLSGTIRRLQSSDGGGPGGAARGGVSGRLLFGWQKQRGSGGKEEVGNQYRFSQRGFSGQKHPPLPSESTPPPSVSRTSMASKWGVRDSLGFRVEGAAGKMME